MRKHLIYWLLAATTFVVAILWVKLEKADERAKETVERLAKLEETAVESAKAYEEATKLSTVSNTQPIAPPPLAKDKPVTMQYKVKAALILKFPDFVTWPDDKATQFGNQLPLCIVGLDPFGEYLKKLIETVNAKRDKQVTLRHLDAHASTSDINQCQAVFISGRDQANLNELVIKFNMSNVLTITEELSAGVINFFVVRENVKFDVNSKEARRAKITISPQLIRIGRR